jgi:hypothetical protein
MSQETETARRVRMWEQHGQTIMSGLTLAALAWTANALIDAKSAQAATAVELKTMSVHIARLEGAVSAMQQQYVTRSEFAVHEQRIQGLEAKR